MEIGAKEMAKKFRRTGVVGAIMAKPARTHMSARESQESKLSQVNINSFR